MKMVLLLAMFGYCCCRSNGQENLIINGGFDGSAASWTLANSDGFGYTFPGGDPGGFVLLAGSPSVSPTASQAIDNLNPGMTYIVSGNYQKMKGFSTDYSFGVAVDNRFFFNAISTIPVDSTWYSFSFIYTATSTSATLSLSAGLNGTGVSYGIDNIAIQPTPEPSSVCLLLFLCFVWGIGHGYKLNSTRNQYSQSIHPRQEGLLGAEVLIENLPRFSDTGEGSDNG